ncbi:MAG: hypothetical protein HWE34_07750 [Methylocystaceae bacterium]|nr:hypothetical protein [Methylocystaceae bacterium]
MTIGWQLGPEIRQNLALRMGRTTAFSISLDQRNFIRRQVNRLRNEFPNELQNLKILPVSTVEWTSEYRTSQGNHILVIDFEQINALNFLYSLRAKIEHPIFHFLEFSIRASELLLSENQPNAALRISQGVHQTLLKYAEINGEAPHFPRPIMVQTLATTIPILKHVIPCFVFGHEFGHHIYRNEFKTFPVDEINRAYEETQQSVPIFKNGPSFFYPHVGPDVEYNIVGNKLNGAALRQSRNFQIHNILKGQIIEEAFSDIIGLYLTIYECIEYGISCEELFLFVLTIFENIEQLSILRNLTNQLGVERQEKIITFKPPKASARFFILLNIIKKIAKKKIDAPIEIQNFLSPLQQGQNNSGTKRGGILRNAMTAQRAILDVVGETKNSMIQRFGMDSTTFYKKSSDLTLKLAKSIIEQNLGPWKVPDKIVDLNKMLRWKNSNNYLKDFEETSLIAYGCATKHIVQSQIDSEAYVMENGKTYETFINEDKVFNLNLVRLPRIFARQQNIPHLDSKEFHKIISKLK